MLQLYVACMHRFSSFVWCHNIGLTFTVPLIAKIVLLPITCFPNVEHIEESELYCSGEGGCSPWRLKMLNGPEDIATDIISRSGWVSKGETTFSGKGYAAPTLQAVYFYSSATLRRGQVSRLLIRLERWSLHWHICATCVFSQLSQQASIWHHCADRDERLAGGTE